MDMTRNTSDSPSADRCGRLRIFQSLSRLFLPTVTYDSVIPGPDPYEVWFHDPLKVLEQQLANPDFVTEMDYAPKEIVDGKGKCLYGAWKQCDSIVKDDSDSRGAIFVPAVVGSDNRLFQS